jgi:hypothetical protein
MNGRFGVAQTDRLLFGVSGNDTQSLKSSPSVQTHSSKSKLKSGISSDHVEECGSESEGRSAAGSIAMLGVVARVPVEPDPVAIEDCKPRSTSDV